MPAACCAAPTVHVLQDRLDDLYATRNLQGTFEPDDCDRMIIIHRSRHYTLPPVRGIGISCVKIPWK